MIYTDSKGVPFVKPEPADYANTTEWLRAYHAYRDAVSDCANRAFAAQWRKSVRGSK